MSRVPTFMQSPDDWFNRAAAFLRSRGMTAEQARDALMRRRRYGYRDGAGAPGGRGLGPSGGPGGGPGGDGGGNPGDAGASSPYAGSSQGASSAGGSFNASTTISTPSVVLQGLGNNAAYSSIFPAAAYPASISTSGAGISAGGSFIPNPGGGLTGLGCLTTYRRPQRGPLRYALPLPRPSF